MIHFGDKTFQIVHEHKDAWNPEAFRDRYSEVLDRYDYIVGDWGYSQLRLKGFFKEGNPRAVKDSSITSLQDYLNEYCNFGCAYFVIERVANPNRPHDTEPSAESGDIEPDGETDSSLEGGERAEKTLDRNAIDIDLGGPSPRPERHQYRYRHENSRNNENRNESRADNNGEKKTENRTENRGQDHRNENRNEGRNEGRHENRRNNQSRPDNGQRNDNPPKKFQHSRPEHGPRSEQNNNKRAEHTNKQDNQNANPSGNRGENPNRNENNRTDHANRNEQGGGRNRNRNRRHRNGRSDKPSEHKPAETQQAGQPKDKAPIA